MQRNEMKLEFDSRSCNESFARVAVAAFLAQLNPTLEEVADVKTAVSEAVTNAIVHGYEGRVGKVTVLCAICGGVLETEIIDRGCGIADVKQAMEPLYTTKAGCDCAGMGFAFMEAFMDTLEVDSAPGKGTRVRMTRRIRPQEQEDRGFACAAERADGNCGTACPAEETDWSCRPVIAADGACGSLNSVYAPEEAQVKCGSAYTAEEARGNRGSVYAPEEAGRQRTD